MALSLFHVLCFPLQGKIVTVDRLSFFTSSYFDGDVPFMEHTSIPYESVGYGIFKDPSLMGVFSLPPPNIAPVHMISIHFDPWVLPPIDRIESWGNVMLLSLAELNYVKIVSVLASSPEPDPSSRPLNSYVQSPWLRDGSSSNPL